MKPQQAAAEMTGKYEGSGGWARTPQPPPVGPAAAGTLPRIVWIDGVGGYLLLDRAEVLLGQAIPGSGVDIGIVGDLSRLAAAVRRAGGDFVLQPLQVAHVNEQPVQRPQLLRDGDRLQFGTRVQLEFRQPHPLSATGRLELLSLHRFQPRVDAVLLLADSCVLGPQSSSHIQCPRWTSEILLFRQADGWHIRLPGEVEVDGQPQRGTVYLRPGMRISGQDFSLGIE
ncbi:MAG: FHA domain-containing protein [Planctomycetales bacterium]|nr:FHA domain-containing protein [Planctomycetales bacterium]